MPEKHENKTSIVYGRMNPPTRGHERAIQAACDDNIFDTRVYLSQSHDPKRNPLSPNKKLKYARKVFENQYGVTVDLTPTIPILLDNLTEEGITEIDFYVGEDRFKEFSRLAENLKKHYTAKITIKSVGDRNEDAEGIEGVSASKLRQFAAEGNMKEFMKGTPTTMGPVTAMELYKDVREGMQLVTEDLHSNSRQSNFHDMYIVTQFTEEFGNSEKFFGDALDHYLANGEFKVNHREQLIDFLSGANKQELDEVMRVPNAPDCLAKFVAHLWSEALGSPPDDAVQGMVKLLPYSSKGGPLHKFHPGSCTIYRGTDKKKTVRRGFVLAHTKSMDIAKKFGDHIVEKQIDEFVPCIDIDLTVGKKGGEDEIVVYYREDLTETHVNARYATDHVVGEQKKTGRRVPVIGNRSNPTGIHAEAMATGLADPDDLGTFAQWKQMLEDEESGSGTYVYLKLSDMSKKKLYDWAQSKSIFDILDPNEFHCTVFYSYDDLPKKTKEDCVYIAEPETFSFQVLGKALVLAFDSPEIRLRHKYYSSLGLQYTHNEFIPHVTLSYDYDGSIPDGKPDFQLFFTREIATHHNKDWSPGDGLKEQKEVMRDIHKGLKDDPSGLGEYKPGAEATEELEPINHPSRNLATGSGSLEHKQLMRQGSFYDYEYNEEIKAWMEENEEKYKEKFGDQWERILTSTAWEKQKRGT